MRYRSGLVLLCISALTLTLPPQAWANPPDEASPSLSPHEPSQSQPHTAPQAQLPQEAELTLDNIGPLWLARLRARCGWMDDEFTEPEDHCLSTALESLKQAIGHFQVPDTSPTETLKDLDRLLEAGIDDLGRQEAADELFSLAQAVPFHPLCLDQVGIAWRDEPRLSNGFLVCDLSNPVPIQLRGIDGKLTISATRPLGPEDEGSMGYIVYQVKHRQPEEDGWTYFLDIQTNTGGTGVAASIWVFHQGDFLNLFQHRFFVPGGDRCNDGNLQVVNVFDDGKMTYSAAATPFRLLNLYDQEDQRMAFLLKRLSPEEGDQIDLPETFMGWAAYRDIYNCAVCCAGEVFKHVNRMTFEEKIIAVTLRKDIEIELYFEHAPLIECARDWFNGLATHETNRLSEEKAYLFFETHDWLERLEDLQEACSNAIQSTQDG